jgi:MPBQ/MSBQ methyltransferase
MIDQFFKQLYARSRHRQPSKDRREMVAVRVAAHGDIVATGPEMTVKYDRDIFDPLVRAYYGRAEFYNVGLWGEHCRDQADASTNLVDRVLSGAADSPALVLDVGCGLGATTTHLKKKWPHSRVIGINISRAQVVHAHEIDPSIEFYVMDATRLAFPDAVFDAVVSIEAAFHFNTRTDFIRESYRILKPGGSLLLADILFEDGPMASAISVWDVCRENSLPDLVSYSETLTRQGFAEINLEDVTRDSWLAWCHFLKEWLENDDQNSAYAAEQTRSWHSSLPLLAQAVRHYFIVSARKPLAGNGSSET